MALPLIPIVITETSGRFRPLILAGPNLPREGGETVFGMAMRGRTTWYPGSGEATSQVLGPQHEPVRMSGMLEDRRTGLPGGAVLLGRLIDQIGRAGREVVLNYGPFTRRCRWLRHSLKPVELIRIAYEIELEVLGDEFGDRSRIVRRGVKATPETETAIAKAESLRSTLTTLADAGGIAAGTAGNLIDEAIGHLNQGKMNLDDVGQPGTVVDEAAAKSALAKFDQSRDRVLRAQQTVQATDWKGSADEFDALSGDGSAYLDAQAGINDLAAEVSALREKTRRLAGLPGQGLIYIAAGGDTLQGIAFRFYGDAERWSDILEANGKAAPTVAAGERLVLRDVPTQDKVVR